MTTSERIGRYQILGELGRGAAGVVYRAHDPAIGRTVAIKTVRVQTHGVTVAEQVERLRREAQSAGRLSHPNIITIYDILDSEEAVYICMELVEGPTLDQVLAQRHALSRDTVLAILRQAADALDYAHQKGVIHRDVKPANLLLHEDRTVKVTDFGIAKLLAEDATATGTLMGTPTYMAPEQIQSKPVGGRADQFSLAVIAYELLTGERPYPGANVPAIVYRVCHENPLRATDFNPTLPADVNGVFGRALARDPALRFPSVRQFVMALENVLSQNPNWQPMARGSSNVAPETLQPVPTRGAGAARRRRLGPGAGVVAFLLAGLAVVAGFFWVATRPSTVVLNERSTASPAAEAAKPPAASGTEQPVEAPVAPAGTEAPPAEPESAAATETQTDAPLAAHDVSIHSEPEGATVVIDNISSFTCVTPCRLTLGTGRHTLRFERDGYRPLLRTVQSPGDSHIQAALEARSGTVMLRSTPAGATVLVDGRELPSRTPTIVTLPAGKHHVVFRREGVPDETATIEVRDGAVANLDVNWNNK